MDFNRYNVYRASEGANAKKGAQNRLLVEIYKYDYLFSCQTIILLNSAQ